MTLGPLSEKPPLEPLAERPARTLRAASLEGMLPGLIHGFSTNLPFADLPSYGDALGGLLAESLGSPPGGGNPRGPTPLMFDQPHTAKIFKVPAGAGERQGGDGRLQPSSTPPPGVRPGRYLQDGHGAAGEDEKGFVKGYDGAAAHRSAPRFLTIRAADCVPVLAVDPEIGVYGALHAGWRGVAAGILTNLLEGWRRAGSSLTQLRLAFGPGIRSCCFEVREDCISAFQPEQIEGALRDVGEATHLELTRVLLAQAGAFGVRESQTEVLPYCTVCHRGEDGSHPFASYRRSRRQGLPTGGRNASFIGLPPPAAP